MMIPRLFKMVFDKTLILTVFFFKLCPITFFHVYLGKYINKFKTVDGNSL